MPDRRIGVAVGIDILVGGEHPILADDLFELLDGSCKIGCTHTRWVSHRALPASSVLVLMLGPFANSQSFITGTDKRIEEPTKTPPSLHRKHKPGYVALRDK